jgi:hypothetical protein
MLYKFKIQLINFLLNISDVFIDFSIKLAYKVGYILVPFPDLGFKVGNKNTKGQGQGTARKLKILADFFSDKNQLSCCDIGSNNGVFSSLLSLSHKFVLGFEQDTFLFKVANRFLDKGSKKNISYINTLVNKDIIDNIGKFDTVVLLSVYHWWVQSFGNEVAEKMLINLWDKTNKYFLFELPNTYDNKKIAKWMPDMGTSYEAVDEYFDSFLPKIFNNSKIVFREVIPSDFRQDDMRFFFILEKQSSEFAD